MKMFSALLALMNMLIVPDFSFYAKDKNQTIYFTLIADDKLTYDDRGYLINISGSSVSGYIQYQGSWYTVTFPQYDQAYFRVSYDYHYIIFDSGSFETNLNLITAQNHRLTSGFVNRQSFYMLMGLVLVESFILLRRKRI